MCMLFLLQISCKGVFGVSVDNYSCFVADYLSFNVSACQDNADNYSILSNILQCDTETGLFLLLSDCITHSQANRSRIMHI